MNHYSVLDGGRSLSSRESHLNFISYWADKTVEEAVLQGQQLRMQKPHPLPSPEYDVVNINFIKPPRSVKSFGRQRYKAAKVFSKRHRSKSPSKAVPPSTNLPRKQKKRQKTVSCGMRIAELAVPTKRHCLETWRDKYSTLPDYMIDRLRQHVLDQRPVVQISDAIYCFRRKCKRQRKDKKSVNKSFVSKGKQIKNQIWKNEVNVLGAIFGHRIAKKLIVPLNIILDTDLRKIAGVITYDIGELMRKSRNIDTKNKMYKLIEKDIVEKVTIWVSGVLNESSDKILEDQLRDFEEEAGPALDCIDDLIDNVLDICIPVPKTYYDDSFASESDGTSLERGDSKPEYVYENITDHFKNEIVALINNIGKEEDQRSNEYIDVDEGPNLQSNVDIEANDLDQKNHVETKDAVSEQASDEEGAGMEQTEDEEGITLEETEGGTADFAVELPGDPEDLQNEKYATEQPSENTETQDTDVQNGNSGAENYKAESYNENIESNDEAAVLNVSEGSIESVAEKADEYLESEDVPQSTAIETRLENTDNITETFADATEEYEEVISEETDKKVTFDKHKAEVNRKASIIIENIEFAEPNEGLLSDADESWPEDVRTPVLRPSQSVSKSITSLGKIKEVEEKLSVKPEEDNEEQYEKMSTKSLKFKDETASKGSEKLKRAKHKRSSESKIGKPPSKKFALSGRQRSLSKSSKIEMPTSPTKPITKTFKKMKDKNKKAKSKDTDSTRTSQSAKDLESGVTTNNDTSTFSSGVKSKQDYRVNIKTAPAWINRTFAEPSCSCAHIPSKSKVKPRLNENLIRRWCEDLEQGYENLKMWNDWVENTTRTVCMLQREIGKSYCSEKCSNKEWVKLKRNIDKDAHLWKKLNHHTQERIKGYKKMFQKRSDTSNNYFICCSLQK